MIFLHCISPQVTPPSCVTQGSYLGPLMILLFINDLYIQLKYQKLFFADDMKLYAEIYILQDCCVLQTNTFSDWYFLKNLKKNCM